MGNGSQVSPILFRFFEVEFVQDIGVPAGGRRGREPPGFDFGYQARFKYGVIDPGTDNLRRKGVSIRIHLPVDRNYTVGCLRRRGRFEKTPVAFVHLLPFFGDSVADLVFNVGRHVGFSAASTFRSGRCRFVDNLGLRLPKQDHGQKDHRRCQQDDNQYRFNSLPRMLVFVQFKLQCSNLLILYVSVWINSIMITDARFSSANHIHK